MRSAYAKVLILPRSFLPEITEVPKMAPLKLVEAPEALSYCSRSSIDTRRAHFVNADANAPSRKIVSTASGRLTASLHGTEREVVTSSQLRFLTPPKKISPIKRISTEAA